MPIGQQRHGAGHIAGPAIGPAIGQTPTTENAAGVMRTTDDLVAKIDQYLTDVKQVTADGTTNPIVQFDPVPSGHVFLLDMLTVFSTTTGTCFAIAYSGPNVQEGFDFTAFGARDVASYSPPVIIPAGSRLVVAWTGGGGPPPPAGTLCLARAQYRLAVLDERTA